MYAPCRPHAAHADPHRRHEVDARAAARRRVDHRVHHELVRRRRHHRAGLDARRCHVVGARGAPRRGPGAGQPCGRALPIRRAGARSPGRAAPGSPTPSARCSRTSPASRRSERSGRGEGMPQGRLDGKPVIMFGGSRHRARCALAAAKRARRSPSPTSTPRTPLRSRTRSPRRAVTRSGCTAMSPTATRSAPPSMRPSPRSGSSTAS